MEITALTHTPSVRLAPDLTIGDEQIVLMTGPCSVESEAQIFAAAEAIHRVGGRVMRGGVFKPRTSPHSFHGLGRDGLQMMRAAADEFDLLIVTEALGVEHVPLLVEHADIIQIGSRNMQHFPLLWALGETDKPVLLKRGFMSTIDEWLKAAEHIAIRGNENIILCERGIRTFETATRNTLDTNAIALAKLNAPFPVIGDPSHSTGRADLVFSAGRAALAAGADGLIVEFHPNPPTALSDADQALPLTDLSRFYADMGKMAGVFGRSVT